MSPPLFAPRARRDLRDAVAWIAKDNPQAAENLVAAAVSGGTFIGKKPLAGRQRLDLLPLRFRFWALRGFPYLLVYDATTNPPQVLRVLHMARDLPAVLRDVKA